ncbi:MAG TPA: DUF2085 domain-containing protein, partial [Vicinamibacterales bacterium]
MSGVIVLIAPLVAFLAITWVWLIVAAPLLPAAPAGILYALGSRICHQISERSFHLGVAQLPVCARCLDIYAGFAIGLAVAVSATSRAGSRSQTPWGLTPRAGVAIGALPTAITVIMEWVGLWHTSNLARAIAGAPLGVAVALVVMAG